MSAVFSFGLRDELSPGLAEMGQRIEQVGQTAHQTTQEQQELNRSVAQLAKQIEETVPKQRSWAGAIAETGAAIGTTYYAAELYSAAATAQRKVSEQLTAANARQLTSWTGLRSQLDDNTVRLTRWGLQTEKAVESTGKLIARTAQLTEARAKLSASLRSSTINAVRGARAASKAIGNSNTARFGRAAARVGARTAGAAGKIAGRVGLSTGALSKGAGVALKVVDKALPAALILTATIQGLSAVMARTGKTFEQSSRATDEQRRQFEALKRESADLGVSLDTLAKQKGIDLADDLAVKVESNLDRIKAGYRDLGNTATKELGRVGSAASAIVAGLNPLPPIYERINKEATKWARYQEEGLKESERLLKEGLWGYQSLYATITEGGGEAYISEQRRLDQMGRMTERMAKLKELTRETYNEIRQINEDAEKDKKEAAETKRIGELKTVSDVVGEREKLKQKVVEQTELQARLDLESQDVSLTPEQKDKNRRAQEKLNEERIDPATYQRRLSQLQSRENTLTGKDEATETAKVNEKIDRTRIANEGVLKEALIARRGMLEKELELVESRGRHEIEIAEASGATERELLGLRISSAQKVHAEQQRLIKAEWEEKSALINQEQDRLKAQLKREGLSREETDDLNEKLRAIETDRLKATIDMRQSLAKSDADFRIEQEQRVFAEESRLANERVQARKMEIESENELSTMLRNASVQEELKNLERIGNKRAKLAQTDELRHREQDRTAEEVFRRKLQLIQEEGNRLIKAAKDEREAAEETARLKKELTQATIDFQLNETERKLAREEELERKAAAAREMRKQNAQQALGNAGFDAQQFINNQDPRKVAAALARRAGEKAGQKAFDDFNANPENQQAFRDAGATEKARMLRQRDRERQQAIEQEERRVRRQFARGEVDPRALAAAQADVANQTLDGMKAGNQNQKDLIESAKEQVKQTADILAAQETMQQEIANLKAQQQAVGQNAAAQRQRAQRGSVR